MYLHEQSHISCHDGKEKPVNDTTNGPRALKRCLPETEFFQMEGDAKHDVDWLHDGDFVPARKLKNRQAYAC